MMGSARWDRFISLLSLSLEYAASQITKSGVEPDVRVSSLHEQRACFVHIMEISWARINDQGEFILGISQDVRFVAPDVLPSSLGVGLDYPTGVWVRDLSRSRLSPFYL